MSRVLVSFALVFLSAAGSPAARAQSTGLDRAMLDMEAHADHTRECRAASMARCWYLFFAINKTPVRQLWMLDLKVRNPEPANANLIEIDFVEMHESDDPAVPGANDFLVYTLQFKCKEKKFRIADGVSLLLDGNTERVKEATAWRGDYDKSWFGLAGKVACGKDQQRQPTAYDMLFLGDFYRPVDVADVTRRTLWNR
jgi:hypothetical protein